MQAHAGLSLRVPRVLVANFDESWLRSHYAPAARRAISASTPKEERQLLVKEEVPDARIGAGLAVTMVSGGTGGWLPQADLFLGAGWTKRQVRDIEMAAPAGWKIHQKGSAFCSKVDIEDIFRALARSKPAGDGLLLLADRASTHTELDPATVADLEAHNCKVVYIPGGATSVLQPLDAGGCFRSMKAAFRRELGQTENILGCPHFYAVVQHYLREYGAPGQFRRCGWAAPTPELQELHKELRQLLRTGHPGEESSDEGSFVVDGSDEGSFVVDGSEEGGPGEGSTSGTSSSGATSSDQSSNEGNEGRRSRSRGRNRDREQ